MSSPTVKSLARANSKNPRKARKLKENPATAADPNSKG